MVVLCFVGSWAFLIAARLATVPHSQFGLWKQYDEFTSTKRGPYRVVACEQLSLVS